MTRNLPNRRAVALSIGVVVQTLVLLGAVRVLVVDNDGPAAGVALGSWAGLGLLTAVLYLTGPLLDSELATAHLPRKTAEPDEATRQRRNRFAMLVCGLAPLAQVPLVVGLFWFLSDGADVDLGYFLPEDIGVVGAIALLLLAAYLSVGLGVLVQLLVWFPVLLSAIAVRRLIRDRDVRFLRPMLAGLIVGTILPMAIAATLGIEGPGGRDALGRLLVVLGFELERYQVVDAGWLWAARVLTLTCAVATAAVVILERRRRAPRPGASR